MSKRFSRLEAMLLAKTFQQPTGQPDFQQVTIPVLPVKQPPAGHFRETFHTTYRSSSQTSSSLLQVPGDMSVLQPTGPVSQIPISKSDMPVLQPTRLVSQIPASKNLT